MAQETSTPWRRSFRCLLRRRLSGEHLDSLVAQLPCRVERQEDTGGHLHQALFSEKGRSLAARGVWPRFTLCRCKGGGIQLFSALAQETGRCQPGLQGGRWLSVRNLKLPLGVCGASSVRIMNFPDGIHQQIGGSHNTKESRIPLLLDGSPETKVHFSP